MLLSPSLVYVAVLAASVLAVTHPDGFFQVPSSLSSSTRSSSCPVNSPASCTPNADRSNLCCYEYPGGLISLTQFWDTHPPSGPSDSWTIHGLWPNHCDGKWDQGCDSSRDYTNIGGLLSDQGAGDTLSFMQTYWVDNHGQTEHFWEHEWDKHGTCYSTLNPSCLSPDSPTGAEAVAFFQTAVGLFQQYNIYNALSNAGITPSSHKTYSLSDLESALSSAFGAMPSFDCHGKYLNEAYIWFNLQGSVIDGSFVPVDAPSPGKCPQEGIRYEPKNQ